jgi:hypothetical protein
LLVAAGVGLALLAHSPASRAQAMSFDVPAECGSELEFREGVQALVGSEAPRAMPAQLRIRPNGEAGYRLTIEVGGRVRELTHADCRVLFRSAVVIAAASVRPDAAAGVENRAPAAPPVAAPAVTPAPASPPPPPAPKADTTAPPRLRPEVAAGAGLALGVVPGPVGTFELRAGMAMESLGFSAAARYFPAHSVQVEGRSADVRGIGFRFAGLYRPWPAVSVSLGFDADWLHGSGQAPGIALPSTDSAWTLAPSAELAVIPIRFKGLSVELAAEGRVAVLRPRFEVTGFGELYRVPTFGGVLLARSVWRFR